MSSRNATVNVLALLDAMLEGIDRGDFMVAPWDAAKACRYCDFNRVCPMPRKAFVERKAGRRSDSLRSRTRSGASP